VDVARAENGETMSFGQMAQQRTVGQETNFQKAIDEKTCLQLGRCAMVGLQ